MRQREKREKKILKNERNHNRVGMGIEGKILNRIAIIVRNELHRKRKRIRVGERDEIARSSLGMR